MPTVHGAMNDRGVSRQLGFCCAARRVQRQSAIWRPPVNLPSTSSIQLHYLPHHPTRKSRTQSVGYMPECGIAIRTSPNTAFSGTRSMSVDMPLICPGY